jgi:hypothetical protein
VRAKLTTCSKEGKKKEKKMETNQIRASRTMRLKVYLKGSGSYNLHVDLTALSSYDLTEQELKEVLKALVGQDERVGYAEINPD